MHIRIDRDKNNNVIDIRLSSQGTARDAEVLNGLAEIVSKVSFPDVNRIDAHREFDILLDSVCE